jgi:hypothetical protein
VYILQYTMAISVYTGMRFCKMIGRPLDWRNESAS